MRSLYRYFPGKITSFTPISRAAFIAPLHTIMLKLSVMPLANSPTVTALFISSYLRFFSLLNNAIQTMCIKPPKSKSYFRGVSSLSVHHLSQHFFCLFQLIVCTILIELCIKLDFHIRLNTNPMNIISVWCKITAHRKFDCRTI